MSAEPGEGLAWPLDATRRATSLARMSIRLVLLACSLVVAACAPRPRVAADLAADPAAARLDTLARDALDFARGQYTRAAVALDPARGIPRSTAPDGSWRVVDIHDWTSGFFAGTLWRLAEVDGDPALRMQAAQWTLPLAPITSGRYDHDLGFQYNTSFGNAWRITHDTSWRDHLLDAARHLAARYDPRVGAIRSWSWGEWRYPVIIDNLMNLELLLRGAREGGDTSWVRIARDHADRTLRDHVRPDGSTFHVVDYDPGTGAVVRRMTRQGYADSSTWARGQAWVIYGFTMLHRETREPRYLAAATRLADRALARVPADGVPCWDYDAPGCPDTAPRDASAAAIMASALLELGPMVGGADGERYRTAAMRTLTTLASPAYLARGTPSAAILRHSVGDHPRDSEIDVGIVYADYYFVEALQRWLQSRQATR